MNKEEIYKIGREANLSNKYLVDNRPLPKIFKSPQVLAYEDAFNKYIDYNGVANTPEWEAFSDGWYSVDIEKRKEERKKLKIDEFIDKLKILCNEYKVSMSFGCGCCGAGADCNGHDFDFKIKYENK